MSIRFESRIAGKLAHSINEAGWSKYAVLTPLFCGALMVSQEKHRFRRVRVGKPVENVLVVHGAGMEKRGLEAIETFGSMRLGEYEEAIREYARDAGLRVTFFHSNDEKVVADRLTQIGDSMIDAVIINPGGYLSGAPRIISAIEALACACIEVHISNPAARGISSPFASSCSGAVTGFGIRSYQLALMGLAARMGPSGKS
ncbi:type II 3-dehydroquinate dehydratase [Ralstonia soli]|uniref:3-dehydroquinate dehydratase n=1 Tax=Ralstonia soli TaxID=2953896 RepID=A0ABT1AEB6_9RALS|nr:type II 3-dehydroquinate dehydratase [Ralstonia soli]MCO5396664.1 3-dehydroquinate dehydratase [Ralstonia soli]